MYGNDDVGDDDEEEDVDDNPTLRRSSSATVPQVWDLLFLWIEHFWLATS